MSNGGREVLACREQRTGIGSRLQVDPLGMTPWLTSTAGIVKLGADPSGKRMVVTLSANASTMA